METESPTAPRGFTWAEFCAARVVYFPYAPLYITGTMVTPTDAAISHTLVLLDKDGKEHAGLTRELVVAVLRADPTTLPDPVRAARQAFINVVNAAAKDLGVE